ncbi:MULTISPECIES: YetF domain-containing protein [unclassified Paenibacillus]|uniref:DUF421 domain-containing protein n=1 Tax=unclassified Paenibacillus TaxID=185978 RepID=UPI001AE6FFB7|nr:MULTISPECIES: YetF domain-containing protein [unclassified Paenibacillus]MBP1156943.1 uncharacterized membrane protein YcaP (DUF421 family) [Paenibacillus sp. PvP091]MBP1172318.1 uncharacterized membrane protein YcaP (DUF421 family) [Paenibacillus sp. PvR098]MBP2438699.1 uncharacterized membrane protein YcaP (DUF421 family) [Paenibacillus sp. PvP052]
MSYIWESLIILFVGFVLIRIAGKKTVSEITGLELITLLAMASVIGHAISEEGLWITIVVLSMFAGLLIVVQYLGVKFNVIERLLMGHATLVVQDGKIIPKNLKKLRMSVDQLEARLRENGISSFSDIKTATIEMSGHLGYELMKHAKPVTMGELEKVLAQLHLIKQPKKQAQPANLFHEVVHQKHQQEISQELE